MDCAREHNKHRFDGAKEQEAMFAGV